VNVRNEITITPPNILAGIFLEFVRDHQLTCLYVVTKLPAAVW